MYITPRRLALRSKVVFVDQMLIHRFQISSNGLSFLRRNQHNCKLKFKSGCPYHYGNLSWRRHVPLVCMCPMHTHTLPVNHTGSIEEGSCRRILNDMSIICRQVLAGRVGKGSNETARGIEEKENVRKSKAQVSNGRPQAMYDA